MAAGMVLRTALRSRHSTAAAAVGVRHARSLAEGAATSGAGGAGGAGSAGAGRRRAAAGAVAVGLTAATGVAAGVADPRSSLTGLLGPRVLKADAALASDHNPMKAPFATVWPAAYSELMAELGRDKVSVDEDELEVRGKETSGYATPENPQMVVWPESTADVATIMKICHKYKVPVVPYAAGTSLEGHTTAPEGGVCISMQRLDKVLAVNVEDMDCVVQPGVGWMELNDHVRPNNMFLGVDPAPGAAIGGMCGTCCSGTNAVRYGTMKDQVLNLTVVLSDGSVVKTGQRARKSSAGYDLARVIVGSEGTLGVVTEATLRLRNIPEYTRVARVSFKDVHDACHSVIKILQQGIQMGAIELLDEKMVAAVNDYSSMSMPLTPCILFKFTGPEEHVKHDIEAVRKITTKFTNSFEFTKNEEETEQLWGARKHAFWAAQTSQPGRELMATDVAVPLSRLADCLSETKKELDASFLFAPIVGHVGDSNFHVCIMFDPASQRENDEAHRLNRSMVYRAIGMEGTCTGEHGVGLGKKEYLVPEFGEAGVGMMKTIKRALDPDNLLNPGKIVDIGPVGGHSTAAAEAAAGSRKSKSFFG
ncbi:hypothetical protein BU14_0049s0001 [Porphyra umbilicalis]|uniref:D-lactate dehydrogenase (cytochrome) n=1 Tax=Porphyra umbilicalis TaxID=2786 RepID=A0A1X6PI96_PORUM|nr:hypothetical protein BU14_0049s0001 [Porphyra umbilicalis]|eukprot:OSX80557.1 hypothetical protein BU14_0049s0001 [Porphyra umbilicalis]